MTQMMYVPEIGDSIVLREPWAFRLFDEGRNDDMAMALGLLSVGVGRWDAASFRYAWDRTVLVPQEEQVALEKNAWGDGFTEVTERFWSVVLPTDTVLKVDRIYFRKGLEGYSSLTFYLTHSPAQLIRVKGSRRRFWAKLADVNLIAFDPC